MCQCFPSRVAKLHAPLRSSFLRINNISSKHAYSQKHHEFEDNSHRDSTERVSCWIKGLENVGNSSRWGQLTKNPDYTHNPMSLGGWLASLPLPDYGRVARHLPT